MIYIFGILFSVLIVVGNSLYKLAVEAANFEPTPDFFFSRKMISFVTSWQLLGGLAFFLVATGISFWMLTKFDFSAIQAVTVPVVMGLSFAAGAFVFNEDSLSLINYVGLIIIIVGVILAAQR